MKAKFFIKEMAPFEQDVRVTRTVSEDVPVSEGDEVIVLVRAKVARVLETGDGPEIDLRELRPEKITQVLRPK